CRSAPDFAGSTSALLPGSSTASQRSISFSTSAGVRSRGMRTGSPPESSIARSYCGMARSAYSRSAPWGSGMAICGRISTPVLNPVEGLCTLIVPNLHESSGNEHDSGHNCCSRKRYVAVCESHIRMNGAKPGGEHYACNREQQTYCERQQSDDESHQQHANWYQIPAQLANWGSSNWHY